MGWVRGIGGVWSSSVFTDEGKTELGAGDEEYQPRPASFECSALGSSTGDRQMKVGATACAPYASLRQYRYPEAERKYDRRAAYHNAKYPWILAVYAFQHKRHHALQFDIARFVFPRHASPGQPTSW